LQLFLPISCSFPAATSNKEAIIGQNCFQIVIVSPSSGMNLGLEQHHGMPQCNSIVRSVTVSRCGDENPYSRGMAIFDSYAGREAAPPGFVVDTDGRRVLKVKSSSGMRTRIVPAGVPGFNIQSNTTTQGTREADKTENTRNTIRGPTAGAVTASVLTLSPT
jgi:hypothetical protein